MARLSILSFVAVCFVALVPGIADSGDFRKATWGMTRHEIKKMELFHLLSDIDKNSLTFKGSISRLPVKLTYEFKDKKLVRGLYVFDPGKKNEILYKEDLNKYIEDWKTIKRRLVKKYGKPLQDLEFWKTTAYRDQPSEWGTAVQVGNLSFFAMWETDTTHIIYALYGEDFKPTLAITYESKRFRKAYDEMKKKQAILQRKLKEAEEKALERSDLDKL